MRVGAAEACALGKTSRGISERERRDCSKALLFTSRLDVSGVSGVSGVRAARGKCCCVAVFVSLKSVSTVSCLVGVAVLLVSRAHRMRVDCTCCFPAVGGHVRLRSVVMCPPGGVRRQLAGIDVKAMC